MKAGSLSRWRPGGKRAEMSERGFGGISGMGWDCWPGEGLGWGSRMGREGRHKACPYGAGWGVAEVAQGRREDRHKACPYRSWVGGKGGGAGGARGQAQGLPLPELGGG